MKLYRYYSIIAGLFTASLLISNTLDTKLFLLGPLVLPAGIILFPITYLFGDMLTEVYGYNASRKVIWTGFGTLILMVLSYEVARWIPAAPFWEHERAFDTIFGRVPRIVAASITAYFLGEFTNSFVLAKLKVKTEGRGMGFRFITSTFFGQAVDTSVFVIIAFVGTMDFTSLISVFLSGWGFKVLWEVIMLPISIPVVKWLKKSENEDYFDKNTNFNPFITMKNFVSKDEVSDFKRKWCNENPIIIELIAKDSHHHFISPILDVGSGLGDIAHDALADKEVICIDVNPVTHNEYPLAQNHVRHQVDFFDYIPEKQIQTVLISHTLQFIDDDVEKLNAKIAELNPTNIVTVVNKNDDFMGTIIDWTRKNFSQSNPEVAVPGFPRKYHLLETRDFTAHIACDSFEELAEQISYLMLVVLTPKKKAAMVNFLKSQLPAPEFTFNQAIEIYLKDEQ